MDLMTANREDGLEEEAFLSLTDREQAQVLQNVDARLQAMTDEQLWEIGQQRCSGCHQIKPLDADHYAPAPRYSHKFRRRCRVCDNDNAKKWNQDHREQATTNRREWVAADREGNRDYQRNRYRQMAAALKYVREHQIPLGDNDNEAPS